ncbi:CCA tRNA nucleotidyltransferase [Thermobispora bispora]|uniref:Polynucleotide adenylyltransferase/metal dependent phosphohydrolase n=1 Tax=Thermobispora bispora (strain ATCC 19993 / DSM 43833 / CBS 139.67 / JCM 10125 / KCTC 9307 / NBRC 14880 / R51) TaxID=469371 RepID=D6YAK6_THEBD|nr:polynucleotide adenylyltransferase/metal dependent phosphohydrolase [Thermobispora bispora DSM 43833]MBO2473316.1 CCA tRNA nucleotidyltransferase [Actinomycetales bacterium]QSI46687.1 CCA tRNA nucleotidyltransferase [Thermobispora bispora]
MSASNLTDRQQRAVNELFRRIAPVADELGELFAARGHELALVGGCVRDVFLGRLGKDLDLTTSARPEQVLEIVKDWADAVWTIGIEFGTVGVRKGDRLLEITTYRSESYDPSSRKPEVSFGDSLEGDLSRRDFTVNAMAVRLPGYVFVDPFGGLGDLAAKVLRTPGSPEQSFDDDPLRMLRAARFAAQLGFTVAPEVVEAMTAMAGRIDIVSAERIRDELDKLICAPHPRAGLTLLVDTGLAARVLPELPNLRLEIDEHHRHKDVYEHTLIVLEQAIAQETGGPDRVLRWAALLHDIGKPKTRRLEPDGRVTFHHHEVVGAQMARKRLTELKFPKDVVADVSRLVELHLRFHGYGSGEWTDSAVRRYVRDAGHLLERLHKLTRADCTTRNKRKAAALARAYDQLEERIARLAKEEELAKIRPELNGHEIQEILGIPPGPLVGKAYKFLLDLRMDRGLIGKEAAKEALLEWARANGVLPSGSGG